MTKPNTIQVSYNKLKQLGYDFNFVKKSEEPDILRKYLNESWGTVETFEYDKIKDYIIIKNIKWLDSKQLVNLITISFDRKNRKVISSINPKIKKEKAIQILKDTLKMYETSENE